MLYQLGSQRIEIIVRKDSGASSKGAKEKDADQVAEEQTQSTASAQGSSSTMSDSARKRFLRVNVTHGVAVAKQVVNLGVNYAVQGIGMKNGDQALQENVSRQFEIVQDVGNVASSVAMGVTYGASGGPVGMALGAVFGLVSSVASIGFKYAGREREFNFKQFKENNAIEYQRARASISLTTGRLR